MNQYWGIIIKCEPQFILAFTLYIIQYNDAQKTHNALFSPLQYYVECSLLALSIPLTPPTYFPTEPLTTRKLGLTVLPL